MCVVPVLRSVNVGRPKDKDWAGLGYTSIDKRPVTGSVRTHRRGLVGDVVSDTQHHGGPDQAVYAFAREDLDHWERELGRTIRDGQFGENLTTEGIDVNEAEIGDHWQIGSAVFEVAYVRTPCNDFKGWMGESGFDNRQWVKRFMAHARPGPYLRVLVEGEIRAGDEIATVRRQGHGVSVSTMFRAINLDHSLLPELLRIDGLVEQVRVKAARIAAGLPPGRAAV
ncbi:MOSC domain-containing protein [Nocardioides sp. AN3]